MVVQAIRVALLMIVVRVLFVMSVVVTTFMVDLRQRDGSHINWRAMVGVGAQYHGARRQQEGAQHDAR